ncbi:hypothetical protein SKAU_G00149070 [Synaphobranchus kaupii]|uniref:Uncharacterized protein n=1 Tax=Synaphobranchus kaupii TaxID=118154 RepID=A0A9Q1FUG0_SYNKA|nr:hypothetical protein SKAU_G00149070 [Synaphobranchus kaupii]
MTYGEDGSAADSKDTLSPNANPGEDGRVTVTGRFMTNPSPRSEEDDRTALIKLRETVTLRPLQSVQPLRGQSRGRRCQATRHPPPPATECLTGTASDRLCRYGSQVRQSAGSRRSSPRPRTVGVR